MKKILLVSIMLIAVSSIFSQDYYQTRLADSKIPIAEGGSYTYVANINVSSANWTKPDSVIILGICIDSAGAIRASVTGADSVRLTSPDFFCYPINIKKIYKLGTDSLLRNNHITVFGHKKKL